MSNWQFVTSAIMQNNGSLQTSDTGAAGATVNAGDLLLLWATNAGAQTVSNLRVNGSNSPSETFTAVTTRVTSGGENLDCYWAPAVATGTPTYGVNYSAATTTRGVVVQIWRPINGTTNNVDVAASATNANSSTVFAAGGTWTTTGVDELIAVGAFSLNSRTWSGFTINNTTTPANAQQINCGNNLLYTWSGTATSPGTMPQSYNQATLASSDSWGAIGASFYLTGGGGGVTTPQMGRCIYIMP